MLRQVELISKSQGMPDALWQGTKPSLRDRYAILQQMCIRDRSRAAKKYGIKFGFYYSHAFDWEHPDAPGTVSYTHLEYLGLLITPPLVVIMITPLAARKP